MIETKELGPIKVAISDQKEFISEKKTKFLEEFINKKWLHVVPESFAMVNWTMNNLGIPSLAVRVDCSPDLIEEGIYEVDANPYGIALATLIPDTEVMTRYIACLQELDITGLKVNVYPSASKLAVESEIFKKQLNLAGIDTIQSANHAQLWASNFDSGVPGFEDDLKKSLMYSLESKWNLVPLNLAVQVSSLFYNGFTDDRIKEDLIRYFPEGYVIKPVDGWGCGYGDPIGFRIVPAKKPFKREGDTQTAGVKMIQRILKNGKGAEYIIQHFYPPRITELEGKTGFQLYRLYLVYNSPSGLYKFVGGWYNFSKSLRGHGSNDTIFGWVQKN